MHLWIPQLVKSRRVPYVLRTEAEAHTFFNNKLAVTVGGKLSYTVITM